MGKRSVLLNDETFKLLYRAKGIIQNDRPNFHISNEVVIYHVLNEFLYNSLENYPGVARRKKTLPKRKK